MPGTIIVLNGAPRSGKSSIARAMQATFPGAWMNLGVDAVVREMTPEALRPGIGLRPGGERPDLEGFVEASYLALYASIAAHSRAGLNAVSDVGHHDWYSRPMAILPRCAEVLAGLPALLIGVRCPIDEIMRRRNAGQPGREGAYLTGADEDPVPEPVRRWQEAVHTPGIYDLDIDTSVLSPEECAVRIRERLGAGTGTAFAELAKLAG
jgi:chloramphenicol 3-O phosphotransferase